MAKQLGLHKVQGRVGEYSYYESKNGGSLMRSINQGMAERVKSSKEYANTRLNNAEFGGAGSCAGAIVRGITSRWRFILSPKATGLLAKAIKAGMMMDTTHAWGERILKADECPAVQEKFNMLSKNQVPDFFKSFLSSEVNFNSSTSKLDITDSLDTNEEFEQELIYKGATGVFTKVYVYKATTPTIGANNEGYNPCNSQLSLLPSYSTDVTLTGEGSHEIISSGESTLGFSPLNSDNQVAGLLIVMLPYKTINNEKHILQELCSAYWTPIDSVTI